MLLGRPINFPSDCTLASSTDGKGRFATRRQIFTRHPDLNIVSIFKFDRQLSHSKERVGNLNEIDRQAEFLTQSKHESAGIIFMDI